MRKHHSEHSLSPLTEVVTSGKRIELCLGRRLMPLALLALAGLFPATSTAQPAPAVEITPNAIQANDAPMGIKITGSRGGTLYVFVLRSCDSNPATPELTAHGTCNATLWRKEIKLDHKGQWHYSLHWTELSERPMDEQLWLRVSTRPDGLCPCGQTIFTIRSSRSCSVAETFLNMFTGGACTIGSPRILIMRKGLIILSKRRTMIRDEGPSARPTREGRPHIRSRPPERYLGAGQLRIQPE